MHKLSVIDRNFRQQVNMNKGDGVRKVVRTTFCFSFTVTILCERSFCFHDANVCTFKSHFTIDLQNS